MLLLHTKPALMAIKAKRGCRLIHAQDKAEIIILTFSVIKVFSYF
jgi:hypothetical protein